MKSKKVFYLVLVWFMVWSKNVKKIQNLIEYRMEVYLAYRTECQLSQKPLKMFLLKRKTSHLCI